MPKVVLSTKARAYLNDEAKYLKERNTSAAESFIASVKQARVNLASFPNIGSSKASLRSGALRSLVVGDYILDYQVRKDEILVVSIRHGRQRDVQIDLDDVNYDDKETPPPSGSKS